ncbi:unnamed protein product [Adineta steineri]|uniref:ubiquitinyl hydrolase 1 n=3 Tax=Adineta steineri TaxID=433720 RepID=A0A813N422_9BILA|nr:unnamed protein product [Adineta steineri]
MNKVKDRTGIYHEHQQGLLCGQHALNNLLQNPIFSSAALDDIARNLDIEEISVLEHTPVQLENMDDTGFYNIQVLQRALKAFEIELVPYTSQYPIAKQARSNPECIPAYICNLGLHWFTIRRIGTYYFNLNSYYYVPELISDRTLTGYLNFITEKGYSVFIVCGTLPACLADEKLTDNPIGPAEYTLLTKDLPKLIVDQNTKYRDKNGNSVIKVPSSLYDELQKNPNDPDIRKKFNQYLPNGVTIDDLAGFSDSPIHKTKCPDHRRQPQTVTEYTIDEPNLDSQNKSHQHNAITSECIVKSQPPNTNNESIDNHDTQRIHQTKTVLEKEKGLKQLVMYQSMLNELGMNDDELLSHEGSTEKLNQQLLDRAIAVSLVVDNAADKSSELIPLPAKNSEQSSTQKLSLSSFANTSSRLPENENLTQPMIIYSSTPTDVHSISPKDAKSTHLINDDELLSHEGSTEKLNQQLLDRAIAASLVTDSAANKSSELIPLPAKNSEQVSTQQLSLSSSKSTNSLPFTYTPLRLSENENSTQPMIIYSSTPTDVHSISPKDAKLTHLTNINSSSSKDTQSFSPKVVEMPSIEELRKLRLQHYGNRDRSIISQASNSYH